MDFVYGASPECIRNITRTLASESQATNKNNNNDDDDNNNKTYTINGSKNHIRHNRYHGTVTYII